LQVFVAASDVIFLFNGEGEWDFEGPGFTAIAHPASVNLAKNHGVFILKDMKGPWEGYKKDPSRPATSATPECFVHKQTADELYEKGAIIPETELVYVDLAYYFDVSTMSKLTEFYAGVKPITCEIDAYGDFLQPLGSAASGNVWLMICVYVHLCLQTGANSAVHCGIKLGLVSCSPLLAVLLHITFLRQPKRNGAVF
jgi:fucose-1-phosphate guanylyltransferase